MLLLSSCPLLGAGQIRVLREGEVVDRALRRGEEHLYEVIVPAGHAALIEAEKSGIDITLNLLTATGELEIGLERPNLYYGRERLTVLANPDSPHRRIAVRVSEDPARNGRYRLSLTRLAATTPRDLAQARAEKRFSDAYNAEAPETIEKKLLRAQAFEAAAAALIEAEDWEQGGFALSKAASLRHDVGNYEQALLDLERGIELATRCGRFRSRVSYRNSRGNTLYMLNRLGEAEHAWRDAEAEATALGDHRFRVQARLSRLRYLQFLFDPAGAWRELEELRRDAPRDLPVELFVRLLTILSAARLEVGDLEGAQQALDEASSPGLGASEEARADLAFAHGRVSLERQDWVGARNHFQEAGHLARSPGRADFQAMVAIAVAQTEVRLGSLEVAEQLLMEAWTIARAKKLAQVEFLASTNLAWVLVERGASERALPLAGRSLELASAVGGAWEAGALLTQARVLLALDRLEEANERITRALVWVEGARGRFRTPSTQSLFTVRVQDYFELASLIRDRLGRRPGQAHWKTESFRTIERSRAQMFLAYLERARVDVQREVPPDLKRRAAELEQAIEESNDRWLAALARGKSGVQDEYSELQRRIDQRERLEIEVIEGSGRFRFALEPREPSIPDLQAALDERTQMVVFSISEPTSLAWVISRHSFETIELPPRSSLEPGIARLRESLAAGSERRIERVVRADLAALSELLLSDVAPRLRAERLVIVPDEGLHAIPFAALSNPVAVARAGSEHGMLLDRFEIVQVPSAQVYLELAERARPARPWPQRVAILGDPIYSPNDERLMTLGERISRLASGGPSPARKSSMRNSDSALAPRRLYYAREEIKAIERHLRSATTLEALGAEATREALLARAMHGYDLVHIVAHGLGDDDHPHLSGLELSRFDREGNAIEGTVRPSDLYGATLDAELVVLSACRSGLGRNIEGEGLVGISRGFQHAGARRVLVSLWDVRDSSSAQFIEWFYDGLLAKGLSPAAALRAAQRRMRDDPRYHEPYTWAGFVLQGDG